MNALLQQGKILFKEDIRLGVENAPAAFLDLLTGKRFGKLLIHVAEAVR